MAMRKLSLLLLLTLLTGITSPAQAQTARQDTFTLLVYMCGADLESDAAHASGDLRELIEEAGLPAGGGVRVLVETGGSQSWALAGVSGEGNQRHLVTQDGLETVESGLGRRNMGAAETLADFIRYGISHYPADRYGLVLWDHGSGPLLGVCFDPLFDGDSLTLSELSQALSDGLPAGERFDLVALDACLMGAVETAAALAPYADYMIASQDLVAGIGMDYGAWVGSLAREPGMSTLALGQTAVDTYIADAGRSGYGGNATLSVVDLSQLDALLAQLDAFGEALTRVMQQGLYKNIVRARGSTRAFGTYADGSSADLVDIQALCESFAALLPVESGRLLAALREAVVYSATSRYDVSGLSLYFPSDTVPDGQRLDSAHAGLEESGAYTGFVRSLCAQMDSAFAFEAYTPENLYSNTIGMGEASGTFVELWEELYGADASGFIGFAGSVWGDLPQTALAAGNGTGVWADLPAAASEQDRRVQALWDEAAQTGEAYYDANHSNSNLWGNPSALAPAGSIASVAHGYFTASRQALQSVYSIQLTRDSLDHLADVQGVLLAAKGDGFALLGELGVTQVDWQTGMVYSLFDGTWPLLEGRMAHVETMELADGRVQAVIPAEVDGESMYLVAVLEEGAQEARVLGATVGYDNNGASQRGLIPLEAGERVVPLFELVDTDGRHAGTVRGDALTVPEQGLTLRYGRLSEGAYRYGFALEDIYGGRQLTALVELSF